MATPGIGDPYWYEWFVGLKYVVQMLNPDSGISCVVFQHSKYNTIDDVVVEYDNGKKQLCYQIKHEISTSLPNTLTFGKMLEIKENKKCLFESLFLGWKEASSAGTHAINPVLYTNRKIHNRRTCRKDNDVTYSAYPIDKFVSLIKSEIAAGRDLTTIEERNSDLFHQWNELCVALNTVDRNELISFFEVLSIEGNQQNLTDLRHSLIESISGIFECNSGVANDLFGRLLVGLERWTTTERCNERVTLEDVYSVLGFEEDINDSQHRLAAPYPFFESRQAFCNQLDMKLKTTEQKVVFLSGDPGSGKTSIISYLQATTNRFLLRYHTFKPISPEQRFYNSDPGMCTPENLWGTLLIQLRKKFHGHLAQYNVPLSNKLVSVEVMRAHVIRLLGILAEEVAPGGNKVFVCIDGIDHAARANTPLSFLSTLPLPSELPDGVCFVIVGQPAAVYLDQYPTWLSKSDDVEHISIPKLCVRDIEQLILSEAVQFTSDATGLANLIFDKTEGNNLSAVFAVEEVKSLRTLEEAVERIHSSRITADIQQYYEHIWAHMKNELTRIVKAAAFPESIIACPLLLMNGRVNVKLLSRALAVYGLVESDWTMILNRLHPLVIPTDTIGEYALFHNDFRIFLMGIISEYQSRYEEIALALAQDLLQNEEGLLTYVIAIPLLECANKSYLIPQYFTPGFIINALAEGVSKYRLDEFAHLSYKAACDNRDMRGLRNTYLAIKTLHQHIRYFEYSSREYNCIDYPEISFVDISEIRILPVEKQNLDEYENVLSLCCKLYSSHLSSHRSRGIALYQKWFNQITPLTFVPLCEDSISEENHWHLRTTKVGFLLQNWGETAAVLGLPVPKISSIKSRLEKQAVITFGKEYFDYCISHQNYSLAISAINAGYITKDIFFEKLEEIYYNDASRQFQRFLSQKSSNGVKKNRMLFADAMNVTCDSKYIPDESSLNNLDPIKQIYSETCFAAVLQAFLLGCVKRDADDTALIALASNICSNIDGNDIEKEQLNYFVQIASLLGKHYWNSIPASDVLKNNIQWLLTTKLYKRFDYSQARRFLLYTLLHSQTGISSSTQEWFINALRTCLLEIDSLGMYYKIDILDYLKNNDKLDIIREYIKALYGENCCNISQEQDKTDMHMQFSPYGKLVYPEMIQKFSSQLKWDVAGYISHKEYAMHAPLDFFSIITETAPHRWKDLGSRLYWQSKTADKSSNHASCEINKELSKAAIACGLKDYWELRTWGDDFRLRPNQIYDSLFEFINHTTTASELESLWLLSCGIHSWYTQDGRIGAKCIFDACVSHAKKIGIDFTSIAMSLTPQWVSIFTHSAKRDSISPDEKKYTIQKTKEIEDIKALYSDIQIDDILTSLPEINTSSNPIAHYSIILDKMMSCEKDTKERLHSILTSVCDYLQSKEWMYERCDSVIESLLSSLGYDAFWEIAKCIEGQLSDYDYQLSSRNIQLLLKLWFSNDIVEIQSLFDDELQTQVLWSNGNNHFDIVFDPEKTSMVLPLPQSLPEMATYILLEQISTKNARKIESAIYAIYLLGIRFPEIMNAISSIWDSLSGLQIECLLLIVFKWAADRKCSKEICDIVLHKYNSCTELSHKYLLHSILLKLGMPGFELDSLSYQANPKEYAFSGCDAKVQPCYCDAFLTLINNYDNTQQSVNAIHKFIYSNAEIEECPRDSYAEEGDHGVPVIRRDLDSVLYAEEKNGGWDSVPLLIRKSGLIPSEDPFLLTEMPLMTFDETWFPNVLSDYSQEKNTGLSDEQLSSVIRANTTEDEMVLAACLWYPWGYKGGKKYCEVYKIGFSTGTFLDAQLNSSIGNYGILSYEGVMEEARTENMYFGGISLFNRLGGIHKLYHSNCQLVPSAVWREILGCKPSDNTPYIWVNENGHDVLRFERIASPYREAIQESYIRQPLLFRWVCNTIWLEKMLKDEDLEIWRIISSDEYPGY